MDTKNQTESLDQTMMHRAIELAARGVGLVSPSPLVGCVIVKGDGTIVGEGCFLYADVKHAETIALEQAGAWAHGATAYISLEPHAHHGRTPPCTEALIRAGIRRVVAPIEDPNPQVSGIGFTHLREAGIEVNVGLMAREATLLNEKYIHFMNTGSPFAHLKLAISLDGRIATQTGDSKWISGEESRSRVHQLRHEYDAILIGSRTATRDDPLLTDRSGCARRRPLVRVILGNELNLLVDSHLGQTARECPVIVFASDNADRERQAVLEDCGVEVVLRDMGDQSLDGVLRNLADRSISSVLVEGGATIAGAFLDQRLIDKVSFFIAPIIVGGRNAVSAIGGLGAEHIIEAIGIQNVSVTHRGGDIEITGYPTTGTRDQ